MVRPQSAGRCVVDIFDEIRDDLRAERAQLLLRRYGVLLVAAVIVIIAGVGGWQALRWKRGQQAQATATTFLDAMHKTAGPPAGLGAPATPTQLQAETGFANVIAEGPDGYRTLARFRDAALHASTGDGATALQMWDDIAGDTKTDPLLRDLASLLWAQNQIDQGAPAQIESHLATLTVQGNPWRPLAIEAQALLALRTGQDARARDLLRQLSADRSAPDGVRARASGLLTRLGDAPAPSTELGG